MSTVGLGRENKLSTLESSKLLIGEEDLQELSGKKWELMSALVENSNL